MTEIFISTIIPWLITIFLALTLLITLLNLPKMLVSFWRMPMVARILLIIIITAGVYVRFTLVPNTHRIYYDEDRYLSYAITFARFNEAKSIQYVTGDELIKGLPDDAVRLTIPVLNAWVFKLFGYSELNVFLTAKVASSLQILLIFLLAQLLFRKYTVSLFSALGMALLPNPVYWSPSASLDSYFVFFALLAFVSALLYAKTSDVKNGLFLSTALFLLLCVRLESFLFLPLILVLVPIYRKSIDMHTVCKNDVMLILFAGVFIGVRALASISVLSKQWCCAEALPIEAFYPSYFVRNLLPNIIHLFSRPEFPIFISLSAIIAMIQMKNKIILILSLWFFGYFILYSTYYAGMFYTHEFSGSYGRYFLIFIPPLLILAGTYIDSIIQSLRKLPIIKRLIYATLIIGSIIASVIPTAKDYARLISISPYYTVVEAGPEFNHSYAENYMALNTPKNAIILSSMSSYYSMIGRTTGLLGLFMEDTEVRKIVLKELKTGRRVFSTYPYQCSVNPNECEDIGKFVEFKPVVTKQKPPQGAHFAEIILLKK